MAALTAEATPPRPNDPEYLALCERIDERKGEIAKLETDFTGKRMTADAKEQWNELNALLREDVALQDELEARHETLLENAQLGRVETTDFQTRRPGAVTGADVYDLSTVKQVYTDPSVEGKDLRDRALRILETARIPHPRADQAEAKAHVERLIEMQPEEGPFSRYLIATDSPEYRRAWAKTLRPNGNALLTRDEQTALAQGEGAMRAMSLTAASGGYAVPFVLDPTIIPTSDGAINPYRAISSVVNITVDEWRGVSSTGITAGFAAEAAASTDNSPTLAQPTVSTEKGSAFVPFSIEIGQDWGSFASEMAKMFQDGKDIIEATKFALGSGTNEPFGVITGATTVFTASNTNSLVVADIYGVHGALGPRFRRGAVWTMNNATADRIRQLDTAGGANLWVQNLQLRSAAVPNGFTDGRMGADLLGKPTYEATGQSGTFTTGQKIAVIGDYSYYKIADRIGMQIEYIPFLFGASQGNLPTGQRGLYAYWRVGAKVLDANAFRVLKLA
jgi:HK97 family phage major capsid protein